MRAQYVSTEFCHAQPDQYRLCTSNICVPAGDTCPCELNVEFRCGDGTCIPIHQQCDGTRHCASGEDEISCPGTQASLSTTPSSELSVSVIVTIGLACTFVCAIICFVLCVFFIRRRKNNTSTESQSAEPLQKGYVSSDGDTSDKYDGALQKSKQNNMYHQKYEPSSRTKYNRCDSGNSDEDDNHDDREVKIIEKWKNRNNEYYKRLLTNKQSEIYDIGLHNPRRGKYTFKPRLKHTQSQIYQDHFDAETHRVLNSYKHCPSRLSLPVILNFDLDTEKFPDQFAAELLCSSTPRQPVRHLVKQTDDVQSMDNVTKATNTESSENVKQPNEPANHY